MLQRSTMPQGLLRKGQDRRSAVASDIVMGVLVGSLAGWVTEVPFFGSAVSPGLVALGVSKPLQIISFVVVTGCALFVLSRLWGAPASRAFQALAYLLPATGVLTVALLGAPGPWAYLVVGLMGVVTAVGFLIVGHWMESMVSADGLGRILGTAAVALVAWMSLMDGIGFSAPWKATILALLPLAAGAAAIPFMRGWLLREPQGEAPPALVADTGRMLPAGVFLALFAVVGGLGPLFAEHLYDVPEYGASIARFMFLVGMALTSLMSTTRRMQFATVGGAVLLVGGFLVRQWVAGEQGLLPAVALYATAFGVLEPVPWSLLLNTLLASSAAKCMQWSAVLLLGRGAFGFLAMTYMTQSSLDVMGLPCALTVALALLVLQGTSDPFTFLQRWKQPGIGSAAMSPALSSSLGQGAPAADMLERHYGEKLSKRELQVARLAVAGVSTKEIAERLFLTASTVKTHLKSVYRKTDSENRNDLYRKLIGYEFRDSNLQEEDDGTPVQQPVALYEQLQRDPATGVYARAGLEVALQYELQQCAMHGRPLAVVALRLSQAAVRSGAGRSDRQHLLVVTGGILLTSLRAGDSVFRWSNQEFAILLPGSGSTAAAEVAGRLAQKINTWAGVHSPLGVTVGWSGTDEDETAGQALVEGALERAAEAAKGSDPGKGDQKGRPRAGPRN